LGGPEKKKEIGKKTVTWARKKPRGKQGGKKNDNGKKEGKKNQTGSGGKNRKRG